MKKQGDLASFLADLANLASNEMSVNRLKNKWPGFLPEGPLVQFRIELHMEDYEPLPDECHHILQLRDTVRKLWVGDPNSGLLVEPLLLSGEMGMQSFGMNIDNVPANFEKFAAPSPIPGVVRIDWRRRMLVYDPKTKLQEAIYFLLQNSNKTRVCANADCPAPYFIAPRSNTKYCSQDCVEAIQRRSKRDWWASSGQTWRKERKTKLSMQRRRK